MAITPHPVRRRPLIPRFQTVFGGGLATLLLVGATGCRLASDSRTVQVEPIQITVDVPVQVEGGKPVQPYFGFEEALNRAPLEITMNVKTDVAVDLGQESSSGHFPFALFALLYFNPATPANVDVTPDADSPAIADPISMYVRIKDQNPQTADDLIHDCQSITARLMRYQLAHQAWPADLTALVADAARPVAGARDSLREPDEVSVTQIDANNLSVNMRWSAAPDTASGAAVIAPPPLTISDSPLLAADQVSWTRLGNGSVQVLLGWSTPLAANVPPGQVQFVLEPPESEFRLGDMLLGNQNERNSAFTRMIKTFMLRILISSNTPPTP